MGQKVRLSTQVFDDLNLIVTQADLDHLRKAIISEPGSGEHKIYAIKRTDTGSYIFDFENVPEP